ncbi:hypothetical protein C8J98_102227 [Luteibacter sp. OK325]|uniref:DUF6519 domain-containing protein n=1 Tax=Luteibacter sp. OK325 TaxID=2135670 RepID=UPI000D3A3F28|nr:DUF6519 domain-containing protein [Luteibacter sp. OK325]PTR34039.1 hypothetical protein C8J98_102227 [Luteibacter sp. OK325]
MKGDFARVTFDPGNHRTRVLQQQGRVLLEADWNEQVGIQLHLMHTLIRDLVGPCWAVGSGFQVTAGPGSLSAWPVKAGHFYVDGILCENDVDCTLAGQPYAPAPLDSAGSWNQPPPGFALWLDVWERHLSAIEAPSVLDVALDGVDTASRAQTIWQIRLLGLDASGLDNIAAALKLRLQAAGNDARASAAINAQLGQVDALRRALVAGVASGSNLCHSIGGILAARATYAWPLMQARLGPLPSESDPCVIAADARYRGCENQLYRVEIHQGGLAGSTGAASGASGASFKFSRENGAVIFSVLQTATTSQADGSALIAVTVASLGRDQRLGLAVNDWVELVDDDYTLGQLAGPLLQVTAIDIPHGLVTLAARNGVAAYAISNSPQKHPLMRRWDQNKEVDAQGCVPLTEGTPFDLEDGIQVTFSAGGVYATGDYWLIPARVAGNGSLDWPQSSGQPGALRSRGMHHYATLGISQGAGTYAECCCRFDSLCALLQRSTNRLASNEAAPLASPAAGAAVAGTPTKARAKASAKVKATAKAKVNAKPNRKKGG